MQKREASFTIQFRHWLKANPMASSSFELKQTTTDSIPFNVVKEHQLDALLACRYEGLLYKIPDDSMGIKPFDLVYLRNAYSWVVIKYPDCFVIIDSEVFKLEMERSKRKSLTSSRAKEIAWKTI